VVLQTKSLTLIAALAHLIGCTPAANKPAVVTAPVIQDSCTPDQLSRREARIAGEAGIELFTLHVKAHPPQRGAVVMMHGAGAGGSATFDLAGASLMKHLACEGFDTYTLDARGFGGSTMPPAMLEPAEKNPPAVRAQEAAKDLAALVEHATRTSSVGQVMLLGWSWGSDVAGIYAGDHPQRVKKLVLVAPVYDRRWPTRHLEANAWREEKRREIEAFYSAEREDRGPFFDYVGALFRFQNHDALRLPNGPYRDIYGTDAPVWDAKKIRAPVLVLRGEMDRASLDAHALKLFADLSGAPKKRYVVLGRLGHFLLRERGREESYEALTSFLRIGD
jgi:pimeloyl-ACP methyl ester carboxylesterase